MILSILLLIDESELLLDSCGSVIWIDISIKSLSDKSLDEYTGNIVSVFGHYRYRLKFFLVICMVL